MILQPLGSGYHEIKVNELSDWDWASSDGTKAANWGSLKGYLCECFYLSSYIQHVSMHFEKSRRLSVLWTIWNFSMISAEKVPGSWFDFCHHRGVDLASMTYKVATNEECFSSETLEIAVFLYHHESCLIKLALESWTEDNSCSTVNNLLTEEFVTSHSSPKTHLSQEKQNGLYLGQKNYDWLTGQFSAVNVEV